MVAGIANPAVVKSESRFKDSGRHVMIHAYLHILRNYIVFRGRTSRADFWWFALAQSIVVVVGLILMNASPEVVGTLLALYLLATLIPTFAGVVRRLHDTGRSFWWLPLGIGFAPVAFALISAGLAFIGFGVVGGLFFTPFGIDPEAEQTFMEALEVGIAFFVFGVMATILAGVLAIVLLVILASPGDESENKYGPPPNHPTPTTEEGRD